MAEPDDGGNPPMFVSGRTAGLSGNNNDVGGMPGTVQLNVNGCVVLKTDDGDRVIIWPKGTRRDNGQQFKAPNIGVVSMGEKLSGDQYTMPSAEHTIGDLKSDFSRLDSCGASDTKLIFPDFVKS